MASSTSMPTARISENSTTMLTVSPASCSPSTPARNDAGIAMPMNSEARKPSANRIIDRDQQHAGGDRVLQVAEHLADDLRLVLREGDVDGVGPGLLQLPTTYFTASTVSIRLAPVRLTPRWSWRGGR